MGEGEQLFKAGFDRARGGRYRWGLRQLRPTTARPGDALVMPKSSAAPASAAASSGSPPSFEVALAELEKLVANMESGNLTLEQSLSAHQRGLELAKFCQDLLARAEQQVEVLEGDVLKKFDTGAQADDE